jgi:serine/threonine protein kinase
MIGYHLSHYLIESELGRGGMGIVYKATDTNLDRVVALKILPASALSSEDDRARFYREAKAAAALNHPHIAQVYQIAEAVPEGGSGEEPRPFVAMEYIEGDTLEDRIKQGPLKLGQAVRFATQIAEALQAAHEKEIVHRDIARRWFFRRFSRKRPISHGLPESGR